MRMIIFLRTVSPMTLVLFIKQEDGQMALDVLILRFARIACLIKDALCQVLTINTTLRIMVSFKEKRLL